MMEVPKVKCPKCHFSNIYGIKKCIKCQTKLDTKLKSCPKCAKINNVDTERCISCGFRFSRRRNKKRILLFNLTISITLMLILGILVYLEHEKTVNYINIILKILAGIFIIGLLISNVNYHSKEKINYAAEAEMTSNNEMASRMKRFCSLAIIVGGILVLVILIVYYLIK